MELVNREWLRLTSGTYTGQNWSATFRRIPGKKDTVYILNELLGKYQEIPIKNFDLEVQEFIFSLEYWGGTVQEALEAGVVDGFFPGKYKRLSKEEVREINPTIWYLPQGWYREDEIIGMLLHKENKKMKVVRDGNPTQIFSDNGMLTWDGEQLATREQYESADRCVGSIFESLRPGENIKLFEGYFILDDNLDLIQDWQII